MALQDQEFEQKVRKTYRAKLPVLDISDFLSGDEDAKKSCANSLREICEDLGFISVVGHGISQAEIDEIENETKRFHALAMEDKLKMKVNQHQRGYIQPKATLIKHSTYSENKKFDLNATLVMATEYEDDDPGVVAGKQFYAKNQWPENLPGFKENVQKYMGRITDVGKSLLPLFALALELEEDYFQPYFENNYTYFRMAYYPPKPALEEDEYGLGAHADTGFMTWLPPAKEEGLQILDRDGNWFWPEVEEGAIIMNLGQFLERWSNERFRATPHRVIPPTQNDRYSVACFVNPNFEQVCECLPTCHGPDNPPKYPTQTYHEFYSWYMHQTYPHYKEFAKDDDSGNQKIGD